MSNFVATISKLVHEMLPSDVVISKDSLQLLNNCCIGNIVKLTNLMLFIELIQLIASESNEICEKETRKTISPEHIINALNVNYREISFNDFFTFLELGISSIRPRTGVYC